MTTHHAEIILADDGPDDGAPETGMALGTTADRLAGLRDAALGHATRAAELIAQAQAEIAKATAIKQQLTAGVSTRFGCEHASKPEYKNLDDVKLMRGAVETWRRAMDADAWQVFLHVTGIYAKLDSQTLEEKRKSYAGDVPEFTIDAMLAEFERLAANVNTIWRRGLANVFIRLDKRFKSHDGFKLGSRIVINHAIGDFGWSYHTHPEEKLTDVDRAFAVIDEMMGTLAADEPSGEIVLADDRCPLNFTDATIDGRPMKPDEKRAEYERRLKNMGAAGAIHHVLSNGNRSSMRAKQASIETTYFKANTFKNGNIHLWFTRKDLVERLNTELAAYYGATLGDAVARGEKAKSTTTAMAKSLQFYRTPPAAAARLVEFSEAMERPKPGSYGYDAATARFVRRVLEPSAGDGALVAAALKADPLATIHAVEVHADRLAILKARHPQVSTQHANFLGCPARPIYDVVLMNPPFGGTHYMDHVQHAWEFVTPGGTLAAILPASAEVSEAPICGRFRAWADAQSILYSTRKARWRDLPAESFAESGTNVNTVMLRMVKPR